VFLVFSIKKKKEKEKKKGGQKLLVTKRCARGPKRGRFISFKRRGSSLLLGIIFLLVFRRQRRIEKRGKIEVQWKLLFSMGKEQKSEEINQDNEFALCFDIFLYFNI
jgi:hypothetical protein